MSEEKKKYVSQKYIESAITGDIFPLMMGTTFEKISDSKPFGKDDASLAINRDIPKAAGGTDQGGTITWPDEPERPVPASD